MTRTRRKRIPSVYPGGIENLRDDQLLSAVRAGDTEAFSQLYLRYARAAQHAATQLVDSPESSEDVTAEAFTVLLEQLLAGNGPTLRFWPDLLTELRATKCRTMPSDDSRFTDHEDVMDGCLSDAQLDSLRREREYGLVLEAFASLSIRSRTVLRRLQIRGMSVDAVAASLRTDTNLVARAAATATEALRVAYLQAHVPSSISLACVEPASRLAAWLCGHLAQQPRQQVSRPVAQCSACAHVADDLARLRRRMRNHVRP
jgi:DNA-directed RNA polymerase specialized sigma24 family protein